MSSSFLFCISIILLVLTLTIESVYYPFLYDDGHGGEEHCCLVQVRGSMCLATPITRSLVKVNKQCSRFDRPKHRRFGQKNKNNEYIDKISRRLNVQKVNEVDDKIFIELQKPLDKNIVKNDLICLTSTNNNINLEKCYVELADEVDNEMDDDDDIPRRKHKRRRHRVRDPNFDHKKCSIVETNEEEDATKSKENKAENEIRRIELAHPIRIREGYGLSFIRKYKIDRSHIRPNNRQQRQCWSWYRRQTQKLGQNPSENSKYCIRLTDSREKCINQIVYNTFNNNEEEQQAKLSFSIGSKLYCKNNDDYNKLLGQYHRGEICFYPKDEIYIEHKFTDIADLSDMYKNKDSLNFIANDNKLTAEFEDDCYEKTNLVEITEPEKNDIDQKFQNQE